LSVINQAPSMEAPLANVVVPKPPIRVQAQGWLLWLVIAGLLAWSWTPVEMYKIGGLVTDWRNMAEFAAGFTRPSLRDWPAYALQMVETVQMALWGTALAVLFGIPLAILSSAKPLPGVAGAARAATDGLLPRHQ
jgi:phosphonate transport system permease protein